MDDKNVLSVRNAFLSLQDKYLDILKKISEYSECHHAIEKRLDSIERNSKLLRDEFCEHIDYFQDFLEGLNDGNFSDDNDYLSSGDALVINSNEETDIIDLTKPDSSVLKKRKKIKKN